MDADDVCLPGRFSAQLNYFQRQNAAVLNARASNASEVKAEGVAILGGAVELIGEEETVPFCSIYSRNGDMEKGVLTEAKHAEKGAVEVHKVRRPLG